MTELVDAKIASIVESKFGVAATRVIWGRLDDVKNYWTRYNTDKPGVAFFPYVAFHRTIGFHPDFKMANSAPMQDADNSYTEFKYMPCVLKYTLEFMDVDVINHNSYIKKYMFLCGEEADLSFSEAGLDYKFRIVPEDAEDNSDLLEEEQDRVLRTTFNFTIDSMLLEKSINAGPILEILQRMHLYTGVIADADLYSEDTITP